MGVVPSKKVPAESKEDMKAYSRVTAIPVVVQKLKKWSACHTRTYFLAWFLLARSGGVRT